MAVLLVEMDAMETWFIVQKKEIGGQVIVDLQNFSELQWKAQAVRQVQETYLIWELCCTDACVAFVADDIVRGRNNWSGVSLMKQALVPLSIRALKFL